MLRLFIITCGFLASIAFALVYGWNWLSSWVVTPLPLAAPAIIELPKGGGLEKLATDLERQNVISEKKLFHYWVRLTGGFQKFQAGTYRFDKAVSPKEIIETISAGKTYEPTVLEYTIPEGFTLEKTFNRLVANGVGKLEDYEKLATDTEFLASIKIPGSSLEGFIYPATYSYVKMPTPRSAITHMVETFWKRLPENYLEDIKKLGLSLKNAVTFASLIELETNLDSERAYVSEVIWSRLKNGEPLAIDAALIYGIKDYDGDIKWKHLKDRQNPYNTRVHKGLPPTPVGAPSVASLLAVLSPSNEGYYYYVLIPGTNRHHFSKSLREHQRHVQNLIKATKNR